MDWIGAKLYSVQPNMGGKDSKKAVDVDTKKDNIKQSNAYPFIQIFYEMQQLN